MIGRVSLLGGLGRPEVGLGLRVIRLLALTQEGRNGDPGKNADDQDDDEELDQGEALLFLDTTT